VSVAWGVLCLDCKELAPTIGDCGFLGAPTLSARATGLSRWRCPEGVGKVRTFGALYGALEGLGLVPQHLADYRAFLESHDAHELFLYNDHMDERELHPRLPSWNWSGVKRQAKQTTGVAGYYVVSCPRCSDRMTLDWGIWLAREQIELSRPAIDSFFRLLRPMPGTSADCRMLSSRGKGSAASRSSSQATGSTDSIATSKRGLGRTTRRPGAMHNERMRLTRFHTVTVIAWPCALVWWTRRSGLWRDGCGRSPEC